jgi:hypothetical protein
MEARIVVEEVDSKICNTHGNKNSCGGGGFKDIIVVEEVDSRIV